MSPHAPHPVREWPRRAALAFCAIAAAGAALGMLGSCGHRSQTAGYDDASERKAEASRLASRGREAHSAGRLSEAADLYTRAIELAPEIPGIRTNLGVARMTMGDYMVAADLFKAELVLFPNACQQALTNLGILYADRGRNEAAHDYFVRAAAMAPYDPVSLRGVITTGLLFESPDYAAIDEYLDRAMLVEKDPKILEDYRWKLIRVEAARKEQARAPRPVAERIERSGGARTPASDAPAAGSPSPDR
ncbi:MAG: tetratricopeptide repeat protein [Phycisphaeraceae bacterium]|nr:MAG: tetratricopeptide repeat protein [Phycisphaeraceae bacterium]